MANHLIGDYVQNTSLRELVNLQPSPQTPDINKISSPLARLAFGTSATNESRFDAARER
jgi:hypothetical protein